MSLSLRCKFACFGHPSAEVTVQMWSYSKILYTPEGRVGPVGSSGVGKSHTPICSHVTFFIKTSLDRSPGRENRVVCVTLPFRLQLWPFCAFRWLKSSSRSFAFSRFVSDRAEWTRKSEVFWSEFLQPENRQPKTCFLGPSMGSFAEHWTAAWSIVLRAALSLPVSL